MTLLFVALTAGCTSRTLEVESNTSWSGSLGPGTSSASIQRSGNYSLDIGNTDTYCWVLQKETRTGSFRVYAKVHTITGVDRQDDETTTADFGVVSGCTH
jgi:hypothetical protein